MESSQRPEPSWILKDPGSFASIHVKLPPRTSVNCESDAVVSFSEGVQVRGVLTGGLIGAFARFLFTRESFFTTAAENTNSSGVVDVMMAPSDPGGIVLHRLTGMSQDDLLLTSGAYIASDSNVKVGSAVQGGLRNSLLSGTGFFLLKASGRGYLACGAYGAVHKYVLKPGESRAVDNGHLVAWSANMTYKVGLASRRGGIVNSVTSGEGLMCYFDGPGVIYLQSHKPNVYGPNNRTSVSSNAGPGKCITFLFVVCFIAIAIGATILESQMGQFDRAWNDNFDPYYQRNNRKQHRSHSPGGAPSYDNDPYGDRDDYRGQREF